MGDLERINTARNALMNYQQADMDGIIVKASRQAIHEVDEALGNKIEECERLRTRLAQAEEVISGVYALNLLDATAEGRRVIFRFFMDGEQLFNPPAFIRAAAEFMEGSDG